MGPAANPGSDDDGDAALLAAHAAALVAAAAEGLPRWVERCVALRWDQWRGTPPPEEVAEAARVAAGVAAAEVLPALDALLALNVDQQPAGPLQVLRRAVTHPTRVLAEAGMPPVVRDADAERLFPDDPYDLVPGAFADIDPGLHDPGLAWGAAKAHVVLRRRRGGRGAASPRP